MKATSKQFSRIIQNIVKSQGINFEDHEWSCTVYNEPYMRLAIERHDSLLTVTHYFEQNGDLVPDPDVEFRIKKHEFISCGDVKEPEWHFYPLAIQHPHIYERAFPDYTNFTDEGFPDKYYANIQKDIAQFCGTWGKNLKAQGFDKVKR